MGIPLELRTQDMFVQLGKYCCVMAAYVFIGLSAEKSFLDKTPRERELTVFRETARLYANQTGIDSECTVNNPEQILESVSGRKGWSVFKFSITDISQIMGTLSVLTYTRNLYSHSVVYALDRIVYDSLSISQCEKAGHPTSARQVCYRGELYMPKFQDKGGVYHVNFD